MMKRWKSQMIHSFQTNNKTAILTLLHLGFPVDTSLCIRDNHNEILVQKTFCSHLSSEYGFLDILQELVLQGSDLEKRDSFNRTCLMIACENGYIEIVHYLILDCKVKTNDFNNEGFGILHISALHGRIEVVKFLINEIGLSYKTPSKHKKTALDLCREAYMHDFDKKYEKVLMFLNTIKEPSIISAFSQESLKKYIPNLFTCHERCKDDYLLASTPFPSKHFQSKLLLKYSPNSKNSNFRSPSNHGPNFIPRSHTSLKLIVSNYKTP